MKSALTCLFIFVCVAFTVNAQPLADTTLKKIDHLFEKWNHSYSPGCAVGIIRNDSLIFSKGYGMANLEYGIPISPATIFHMASVSKQFTAFAIVLLARQGKLQLDDDIHTYLSWFPDLKEKITVRQLLHHTSGIRDQWQLLAISGTRLDDVITQEHIVKVLSRQQALNFKPGEQYNYSNSGFTMLAEIVKAVSGQTLRQFADSAIFRPLGMNDTHFHDDCAEIVKDRSYSYDRTDSTHFKNSVLSYSNMGATSLFTNINDMSKWIMNFYTHRAGDQQDIDLLTQKGTLNNGREIDYALGIGSFMHKGQRYFSHGGSDAGYRTFICVSPDLKIGFVVFCNVGDSDPAGMAIKMIDLLVRDNTNVAPTTTTAPATITATPAEKKADSSRAILKNTAAIRRFEGDYISEEGTRMHFRITDDKLYRDAFSHSVLMLEANDSFTLFTNPVEKYAFRINKDGDTTVVAVFSPDNKEVLQKYIPLSPTERDVAIYTGTYFCPELDCRYGIALKDHHLVLTNNKYNDTPITLAGPDHLFNDFWGMHHLKVIRNSKNQITGFEVNSGRVTHLRFNKL